MLYNNLIIDTKFDFDKERVSRILQEQMILKCIKRFEYINLPDELDADTIEVMLQFMNPAAAILKPVGDKLVMFNGSFSEFPDVYYKPTALTIANPALNISGTFKFDEDCVLFLNDSNATGISELNNFYANLLTESLITLRMALINHRAMIVVDAPDDQTKESADKFFDYLESGKLSSVLSSKKGSFLDGLKSLPYASQGGSAIIKEAIEAVQYIYGQWYLALGLKSAFNIKREAINSAESDMSDSLLLPSTDDMLECRQKAFDKAYEMYPEFFKNGKVVVKRGSSWEDIQEVADIALEESENENEEAKDEEIYDEEVEESEEKENEAECVY